VRGASFLFPKGPNSTDQASRLDVQLEVCREDDEFVICVVPSTTAGAGLAGGAAGLADEMFGWNPGITEDDCYVCLHFDLLILI